MLFRSREYYSACHEIDAHGWREAIALQLLPYVAIEKLPDGFELISPNADCPFPRTRHVLPSAAELGRRGKFDRAAELLSAAIACGRAQPWMYEALALALEASGRPREEVERALLSAAKFAATTSPSSTSRVVRPDVSVAR